MKYTITILFIMLLMFAGCATTRQAEVPTTQLELLSMTPLPPLKASPRIDGLKMNLLMHIIEDGTVENVKMLGSTGDTEWDSLALQCIRQWKFASPLRDGKPSDIWARQLVIVQIQEPLMMNLSELTATSQQEADSLYVLLEKENGSNALFKQAPSAVNIMGYPARVREELKKLGENEFTRPLRVGDKYVIYKRFPAGKNITG